MHAVVIVESGRLRGRRQWLRQDQILTIGSSRLADFAVGEDPALAELHFTLRTCREACWISTVRPGVTTLLNSRPVFGEQPLTDGDVITAGTTCFRVSLQGTGSHGRTPIADRPTPPPRSVPLLYAAEACACGRTRFVGTGSGHSLLDLARYLSARQTMHLVVNFRNARVPVPHGLGDAQDLLAHLVDLPLAHKQLLLLSPSGNDDLLAQLSTLLGKDAVCCVFSPQPARELVAALRPAAISYSSPSILNAQLATCPEGFVQCVLAAVTVLLVESRNSPGWFLYANSELAPTWREAGLPNPPAEPPAGGRAPAK